jgi:hypothetical protein
VLVARLGWNRAFLRLSVPAVLAIALRLHALGDAPAVALAPAVAGD